MKSFLKGDCQMKGCVQACQNWLWNVRSTILARESVSERKFYTDVQSKLETESKFLQKLIRWLAGQRVFGTLDLKEITTGKLLVTKHQEPIEKHLKQTGFHLNKLLEDHSRRSYRIVQHYHHNQQRERVNHGWLME